MYRALIVTQALVLILVVKSDALAILTNFGLKVEIGVRCRTRYASQTVEERSQTRTIRNPTVLLPILIINVDPLVWQSPIVNQITSIDWIRLKV